MLKSLPTNNGTYQYSLCHDNIEEAKMHVRNAEVQKKVRELHAEVRKLKFQLGTVKTDMSSPAVTIIDKDLRRMRAEQVELLAIGRNNQFQIAKAYSAIPGNMVDYNSYPLHSKILLGRNRDQRRETLLSMKDEKLCTAFDFVMNPNQLLGEEKSRYSDQIFETDEGDWCSIRFETIQYPGVESLEQVFDAVLRYFNNVELYISEKPGGFAVRDDFECLEGIKTSRLMSTNSTGTTIESNTVVMSQLFSKGDKRFGVEPIGIVLIDSVDEDKLFPREPNERVRHDGTRAMVLTTTKTYQDGNHDQCDESNPSMEKECVTTVTLRRADYVKLYHPEFPLSAEARLDLRDEFIRSGDFMKQEIRRIVYGHH
ncbi:hypothetical protein PHMEG_0003199 [Phytophthora megakarya]|uniref:Uncharacterized protein n=1 Tax=Phytophthora megakarya TaxID=4795 RepID=A0A225WWN0_9STRA|nr:hypothetical protein PHMEG_0003199 [Phytophthora megakarya]